MVINNTNSNTMHMVRFKTEAFAGVHVRESIYVKFSSIHFAARGTGITRLRQGVQQQSVLRFSDSQCSKLT